MAGVSTVAMTNDPLHSEEQRIWMNGYEAHPQFHAVLRLDRIVRDWPAHWQTLAEQGYAVEGDASGRAWVGIRRFLWDCYQRMRPVYMAVSLPGGFELPGHTVQDGIRSQAV